MRIAIVGAGIAGLGAAYVLSRTHEVELFERNGHLGGHTNTVAVPRAGGELALDTGFIVMNEHNYPLLTRLFGELGIHTREAEMSFSVTCARCRLQYSGRRPLAQPGNAARPGFLRLVRDVARFLRSAGSIADDERYTEATLARYVAAERYSVEFRDHFLVPLTAALWSTAPGRALDFPAVLAVRFLDNHGMLGFRRRRWRTVVGGSREYVRALRERMGGPVHLGLPVTAVARHANGVELRTADGRARGFDRLVLATHADEALGLLADPADDERRILGAFPYTRNETVLHTDARLLPFRPAARSSWNFHLEDCSRPVPRPTVTYSLNRLQGLAEPEEYCVTLNRTGEIGEDRVIRTLEYDHPLYTVDGLRAQSELQQLSGPRHTVFCGAYHGFGFHEDGLASGVAAARRLGVRW